VPGWRFFLVWMLTFLGFPVGGVLAIVLVGSIDGAADSALGGATVGVVIGVGQWLVIRAPGDDTALDRRHRPRFGLG
jgi:hypothetical protein